MILIRLSFCKFSSVQKLKTSSSWHLGMTVCVAEYPILAEHMTKHENPAIGTTAWVGMRLLRWGSTCLAARSCWILASYKDSKHLHLSLLSPGPPYAAQGRACTEGKREGGYGVDYKYLGALRGKAGDRLQGRISVTCVCDLLQSAAISMFFYSRGIIWTLVAF